MKYTMTVADASPRLVSGETAFQKVNLRCIGGVRFFIAKAFKVHNPRILAHIRTLIKYL
jgi:hypothetical protein